LRIGFGIKGAAEGEVSLPELFALLPALKRGEPIPFGPFISDEFFWLDHAQAIAALSLPVNRRPQLRKSRSANTFGFAMEGK
jgi:hypothetical protein